MPAAAPDGVLLGHVVGAHGLRGALRVRPEGGDSTNLLHVVNVRLIKEGQRQAVDYEVARAEPGRSGEMRLTLVGVRSRDEADGLRGSRILARPQDLERLDEGEYYEYELVGCRVIDGEGREIGTVRGIWTTGAPDVLVVEDDAGTEHLIPTAREIMRRVDVEARVIVIEAIPGLLGVE
jgi:16S rRNA processing protein RimM